MKASVYQVCRGISNAYANETSIWKQFSSIVSCDHIKKKYLVSSNAYSSPCRDCDKKIIDIERETELKITPKPLFFILKTGRIP